MPRRRTGSLELRDGIYHARVTVDAEGGPTRPWFCLNTSDEETAKKRLERLVTDAAAGKLRPPPKASEGGKIAFRAYAEPWVEKRIAQGIVMAVTEKSLLERDVYPAIGKRRLVDVQPAEITALLEASSTRKSAIRGATKKIGRSTVDTIRAVVHRVFDQAWRDGLVLEDPTKKVRLPRAQEVEKERAIVTDDELLKYLACPEANLEIRMMSLVARSQGGMRTGDLTRWSWTMIDREHFATCTIPRSKKKRPQKLAVPPSLRPFLRAWWEQHGSPEDGPVFPRRRGPNAGEYRKPRGVSFAAQLRRDLLKAGVDRHELHHETETTKPVDFHSFRRSFSTALAEADVSPTKAMALADHEDMRVHERYVMRTAKMQQIPEAALLDVSVLVLPRGTSKRENHELFRGDPHGRQFPPAEDTQSDKFANLFTLKSVTGALVGAADPRRFATPFDESSNRGTIPACVRATFPTRADLSVAVDVWDADEATLLRLADGGDS